MTKVRVMILDLSDGIGMRWLELYADNLEVVGTASHNGSFGVPLTELMQHHDWDYLLVFASGELEALAEQLVERCGIPRERVIFPYQYNSIIEHHKIAYYMFNDHLRRRIRFFFDSGENNYTICTVEGGLSYVGGAWDLAIMWSMLETGKNWAIEEMKRFHHLSGQYYSFSEKQNLFCDIGANIGTTSVYFKKVLDTSVNILAFEPMPRIFRMLSANMVLNDICPSEYTLVNKGVSDKSDTLHMTYHEENPGASTFTEKSADTVEVSVISFDEYLLAHDIDPYTIKYLWIDVEGFEAAFCAGAEKTLSILNVPIVMEFTPHFLRRFGDFDRLMSVLQKYYTGFIRLDDKESRIQEVLTLNEYRDAGDNIQFDIFLLK